MFDWWVTRCLVVGSLTLLALFLLMGWPVCNYFKYLDTFINIGIFSNTILIFKNYFIYTTWLGLCLYITQLGVAEANKPLEWHTYFIAAGLLCFISRGLKITPYLSVERKDVGSKIINHLIGLAFVGAFIMLIHFGLLWIVDPKSLSGLLYTSDGFLNETIIVIDVITTFIFIFGFPLVLATVGDGIFYLGSRIYSNFLKGKKHGSCSGKQESSAENDSTNEKKLT